MTAKVHTPGRAQVMHLLSNGRYAVLLGAAGDGCSAFEGYALTRWSPDAVSRAHGFFAYIRDTQNGAVHSAALQPTRVRPDTYELRAGGGIVTFIRRDGELVTRTDVCVASSHDAELRRITLTNHGAYTRRIELTTYADVVLNRPAADAAHPAFSKLFVQTGWLPRREALIAWRRLRSPDDDPIWLVHRLLVEGASEFLAFETDRARFIGRGRTAAAPHALCCSGPLSATVGNVLDPIVAMRRVLVLEPGASATAVAVLGAGSTREDVDRIADAFDSVGATAQAFESAVAPPGNADELLGIPPSWRDYVRIPGTGDPFGDAASMPAHARATASPATQVDAAQTDGDGLRFFNGHGGFSADGTEYVIRVGASGQDDSLPPLPWANVIANDHAGVIATERGALHTWAANSRENRITPWTNDPVSDPHVEAFWVRDDRTGEFWSPAPGPSPSGAPCEVRHGFGYTRYSQRTRGLSHEMTVFVPREDPLRIVRIGIRNEGDTARRLSLWSYAQLVLGGLAAETGGGIATSHDPGTGAILARNAARGEFSDRVAFAACVSSHAGETSWTTARAAFLGAYGDVTAPAALMEGAVLADGADERGDVCAAHRFATTLEPGATLACAFLLGEAESADAAKDVLAKYDDMGAVDAALDDAIAGWRELLDGVRIDTPSPELDLMVNGWLAYQNLSCRMRGRTAFYQSGGAFGFRDQLQDSAALLYLDPTITRRQILLHAAHQFVEGDVLHWWHPPASKGIRTRFADDLLWLPYIACFYIARTGDTAVLDERVRFVTARQLEPGEDEAFVFPEDASESAVLYEHCCRALDRSLTRGAHGLPLMGTGDWNDGMNRVGRQGRGESVWLGFFLYDILDDFIPLCEGRGDAARAQRYRTYRRDLGKALNDGGWDGDWYRRAYYDDGTPLGSAANDECRIDTIAQAWAVISGAAPADRGERALDALEEHLIAEEEGIIRLLTPAFDRTPHDPGYIKGYLPGVRENGGQYTHGALWAVRALAEAGRAERAARLLEMISPVSHGRTAEEIATYKAEPYVIAADVYGVAPHVGRAGWTWYTGSAGWMYRVALESILGFDLRPDAILLRPCIPAAWPGFRIRYRVPGAATVYDITVDRGRSGLYGEMEGKPLAVTAEGVRIPLAADGGEHHVRIALGRDAVPRYVPRLG